MDRFRHRFQTGYRSRIFQPEDYTVGLFKSRVVGSDKCWIGLDIGSKHGIEIHKLNPTAPRSRSLGFGEVWDRLRHRFQKGCRNTDI